MADDLPVRGVDEVLADARAGLDRVEPADLPALAADGALVIDIREGDTRRAEGHIPGAVVVSRLVLEWRLDRSGGAAMADPPGRDDLIVVVCTEGYSSSLAARDLRRMGFSRATDLIGGFRAYAAAGLPVQRDPSRTVPGSGEWGQSRPGTPNQTPAAERICSVSTE